MAAGDISAASGAYLIACFAIWWAWTSFSWYASAFDTDDWAHRLLTMVQMVGVVMALGFPHFIESVHDAVPHNGLMVAGYIVMRVAMVVQWLRVSKESPSRPAAVLIALGPWRSRWCGRTPRSRTCRGRCSSRSRASCAWPRWRCR